MPSTLEALAQAVKEARATRDEARLAHYEAANALRTAKYELRTAIRSAIGIPSFALPSEAEDEATESLDAMEYDDLEQAGIPSIALDALAAEDGEDPA